MRALGYADAKLTSDRRHARFHGDKATDMMAVKINDPTARCRPVGLVTALTYDARGLKSDKADKPYRHYFGDTDGSVSKWDPANEDACPTLCVDGAAVHIVRRSSNRFRLDDWLIG